MRLLVQVRNQVIPLAFVVQLIQRLVTLADELERRGIKKRPWRRLLRHLPYADESFPARHIVRDGEVVGVVGTHQKHRRRLRPPDPQDQKDHGRQTDEKRRDPACHLKRPRTRHLNAVVLPRAAFFSIDRPLSRVERPVPDLGRQEGRELWARSSAMVL